MVSSRVLWTFRTYQTSSGGGSSSSSRAGADRRGGLAGWPRPRPGLAVGFAFGSGAARVRRAFARLAPPRPVGRRGLGVGAGGSLRRCRRRASFLDLERGSRRRRSVSAAAPGVRAVAGRVVGRSHRVARSGSGMARIAARTRTGTDREAGSKARYAVGRLDGTREPAGVRGPGHGPGQAVEPNAASAAELQHADDLEDADQSQSTRRGSGHEEDGRRARPMVAR